MANGLRSSKMNSIILVELSFAIQYNTIQFSAHVMDLDKHAHVKKDFYVGDEAYAYDVIDPRVCM